MDLEIYDDTKNVPEEKIKLIEDILNFAGSYLKLPENTEMSVTLMDNEHIHEINKNIAESTSRRMSSALRSKKTIPTKFRLFCRKMKSSTSPKILATSWFRWTRLKSRPNIWDIRRIVNLVFWLSTDFCI